MTDTSKALLSKHHQAKYRAARQSEKTQRPTSEFLAMMEDGPIKKFQLIKFYGPFIRAAGLDPDKMSCAEIDAALAHIKAQF